MKRVIACRAAQTLDSGHGPVVLGTRRDPPAWFRPAMVEAGAVPSTRFTGFPWVFQHDSPLLPEQCGGPLVGLDGTAVGLNIARFGRVESLAIPADRVQERLRRMRMKP